MPSAPLPVVHALAASEAIRQINHLTIAGNGGLVWPSDLYACVGALAEMVQRLPQALEQLGRLIREAAGREGLYDDRGGDEVARMTAVLAALLIDDAVPLQLAGQIGINLASAANRLSHLGVRDD